MDLHVPYIFTYLKRRIFHLPLVTESPVISLIDIIDSADTQQVYKDRSKLALKMKPICNLQT